MAKSLYDKIQETAAFLKAEWPDAAPRIGIILGSGLGPLADRVTDANSIPYNDIPHFPEATVQGHGNRLILGKLGGKEVVMMHGRFHYYEGYSLKEVTFPVRVMRAMGVDTLIVSNAAGGMHRNHRVGDIVIITDQINLTGKSALRGPNDDRLGPRFPDMSEPFSNRLIEQAKNVAARQGIEVKTGVYAGVQGPTFETRAEYAWIHGCGADLVGMSTVPEVIVAMHAGMQVFGASIVTDIGIREELNKITHEEVLEAANAAAPRLAGLVEALVSEMGQ